MCTLADSTSNRIAALAPPENGDDERSQREKLKPCPREVRARAISHSPDNGNPGSDLYTPGLPLPREPP
jgi:hypothetical protein